MPIEVMQEIPMDHGEIWSSLAQPGGKIIYLVMDGLGGLQSPEKEVTELQAAHIPNLDGLAKRSVCGLLDIVGPGITPGSGPGHLALFGYNPLQYNVGRGIFSALGIDFDLQKGDVACRINFATIDDEGIVRDRRAGRIETAENKRLCEKIENHLHLDGFQFFLQTVSEHRAMLVLRGEGLSGNIEDTDPQQVGKKALDPVARDEESEKAASVVKEFIAQAKEALQGEERGNMVLMRGFEAFHPVPSLKERFGLNALCLADYPMYRGVSRFVGMDVLPPPGGLDKQVETLKDRYASDHDFFFLHWKKTDSAGEDGDFDRKVEQIELADPLIPEILSLDPDVLVVTGDHSTPAVMGGHSWHPVPVMLYAKTARVDTVETFDEIACIQGGLGKMMGVEIMGMSLAHAKRLKKYGA